MVDQHTALFHDLLEVPVAPRVGRMPADADQDHLDRKARPFEVEYVGHLMIGRRSLSGQPASVC